MKTFVAEKKEKLSELLLDFYAGGLSYAAFCKLLRKKDIKVNGKRTSADILLSPGDVIVCYFDGERRAAYGVIYKDENIVAVDKRKGIGSEEVFGEIKGEFPSALFCHRLDTNTDGIMIFALNPRSYTALFNGFKARSFEKFYIAEVWGHFEVKRAVLTAYLKKDEKNSLVRVYDEPIKGAKKIITGYEVLKEKPQTSLVEVEIFTGRTHQIRAHLAHEGHFVLGDGKYGVEKINRELKVKELKLTSYKTILHFGKQSFLSYLDGFCLTLGKNPIKDEQ